MSAQWRSPSGYWTSCESQERSAVPCLDQGAHLDHGQQALVGGGVSGDGEATGRVSGDDAVHCAPGLGVRLVLVGHRQVGDDDVDSVLVDLPEELRGDKDQALTQSVTVTSA